LPHGRAEPSRLGRISEAVTTSIAWKARKNRCPPAGGAGAHADPAGARSRRRAYRLARLSTERGAAARQPRGTHCRRRNRAGVRDGESFSDAGFLVDRAGDGEEALACLEGDDTT